ncbi:MAG: aspartate aminotransferase family protein [Polyangiaceae bacterium]|nr:aspartate aminotransferase family protein [Polyangiaceae bacterium]
MATISSVLERRERVVPRGVARLNDLVVERAEGARLHTADGRAVLDFATGIAVMSVGHCHPRVVERTAEQLARLQHVCFHVATYEPYVALCERLAELVPHGDRTKAMLVSTGAEAVENAIKIARSATRRSAVIAFSEGFHGRTLLGATLTSKTATKRHVGPLAPEVYRVPFPNRFLRGDGLAEGPFVARELERLERAFTTLVAPDDVAAILVEVVQGEGGFVPCPTEYLRGLRRLCDHHGILLVFDEIQTGFGRTGAWGAFQHAGVVPDLSTWAKAMGGGLPVAAVVGRAEVMDAPEPGILGGTFGGNPVACASALATLEVMQAEDVCGRAGRLGERIHARLAALRAQVPAVAEVRGLGAMQAFELCEGGDPRRPRGDLAAQVVQRCLARGLLLLTAGVAGNVVRLLPPLLLGDDELDVALDTLEESVRAACA